MSTPPQDEPDRLTIRRLLVLTAGVAIGVTVFSPKGEDPSTVEYWLRMAHAFVAGLALPAPLFSLRFGRHRRELGAGGLFALMSGLGTLLMLPPVAAETLLQRGPASATVCFFYVLPMAASWYMLAAILSGSIGRKLFHAATPWVERYGFLLAALWSPLGVWELVNFYLEAFR
jgi:hypothetical protein